MRGLRTRCAISERCITLKNGSVDAYENDFARPRRNGGRSFAATASDTNICRTAGSASSFWAAVVQPDDVLELVELMPGAGQADRLVGLELKSIGRLAAGLGAGPGPVAITIAAAASDGRLELSVENDMSGGPALLDRKVHGLGIGLRNVAERIHATFDEYGSFSARRISPTRFRAVLRIPLLPA